MEQNTKSITKRVKLYVLLTVLTVLVIFSAFTYYKCYQASIAEKYVRYVGMMNVAAEKIGKSFIKIDDLSEGLGLGLPLCKRQALSLGGDLIYDANYKEGCRFIVEMPK